MSGSPLEIMDHLKDLFAWYDGEKGEDDLTLKLSKSTWKVQVIAHAQSELTELQKETGETPKAETDGPGALICGELHDLKGDQSEIVVSLVRKGGDSFIFAQAAAAIEEKFKKYQKK